MGQTPLGSQMDRQQQLCSLDDGRDRRSAFRMSNRVARWEARKSLVQRLRLPADARLALRCEDDEQDWDKLEQLRCAICRAAVDEEAVELFTETRDAPQARPERPRINDSRRITEG